MNARRRIGWAIAALGLVAVGLAMAASPAAAVAPTQTGWWFELQTATLPAPLPSPPTVPDGGLYVQQGPQGPVAYGAVRYEATDVDSGILTLAAAAGSTTTLGAPVQACRTTASWSPPAGGPGNWEDAPKYGHDCTLGAVSSDGKYVAFFFGAGFFEGGALDVAIVPKDGATPFAIAFDKPANDSLALKAASSAPSAPKPPAAGAPSTPGVSASPAAAPVARAAPSTPAAPATPAPAPADTRTQIATNLLNVAGLGDPDRGARALALGGASLIVVGWWLSSTRALPTPRLLGALAGGGAKPETTERVGGVGRFARTRDRDARSLR